MKQTAVEWLALYIKGITSLNCDEIIKQAKAMEKEQIIEAWNVRAKIDGVLTYTDNRTAEQYYKETYESNT
jgi:hypothetical protein